MTEDPNRTETYYFSKLQNIEIIYENGIPRIKKLPPIVTDENWNPIDENGNLIEVLTPIPSFWKDALKASGIALAFSVIVHLIVYFFKH